MWRYFSPPPWNAYLQPPPLNAFVLFTAVEKNHGGVISISDGIKKNPARCIAAMTRSIALGRAASTGHTGGLSIFNPRAGNVIIITLRVRIDSDRHVERDEPPFLVTCSESRVAFRLIELR